MLCCDALWYFSSQPVSKHFKTHGLSGVITHVVWLFCNSRQQHCTVISGEKKLIECEFPLALAFISV